MRNSHFLKFDTFYHIYSRGNNREDIFTEHRNYEFFIRQYQKYINPVANTLAYCLLKNHFHLLVWIKSEEEIVTLKKSDKEIEVNSNFPSLQFSYLLNSYAKAINKSNGRTGSLFQRPFGRKSIFSNEQLFGTVAYIHQNPVKHQFAAFSEDWIWSSYHEGLSKQYKIISSKCIINIFGSMENYLAIEYPMNGIEDIVDY